MQHSLAYFRRLPLRIQLNLGGNFELELPCCAPSLVSSNPLVGRTKRVALFVLSDDMGGSRGAMVWPICCCQVFCGGSADGEQNPRRAWWRLGCSLEIKSSSQFGWVRCSRLLFIGTRTVPWHHNLTLFSTRNTFPSLQYETIRLTDRSLYKAVRS